MVNLNSAQGRLAAMLLLTTSFFIVEIVVGYITNSMALIADSFHMFSDAIALVIAFISVRMSPKKWSKNTFGWARAEILGALINAVFLCALCVSILIESIKRFLNKDQLHEPHLLLVVGALGLIINLIGLFLFRGHHHHHHHHHHGHSHGHSHNHNHSLHEHGPSCENEDDSHTGSQNSLCNKTANHSHTPSPDNHDDCEDKHLTRSRSPRNDNGEPHQKSSPDLRHTKVNILGGSQDKIKDLSHPSHDDGRGRDHDPDRDHDHDNDHDHDHGHDHGHGKNPRRQVTSNQMNMHGVFLHVLADALGSVVVTISAIITIYTDWLIKPFIDPTLSILMVCLILRSTWPLLTESAMILLQTVPTHIEVDSLRHRLTREIPGVLAVHEFHVWQLAGDRIIASAHIRCHNLQDYMRIAEKVKEFFHNEGIHSTTIQPEFIDVENESFDNGTGDNCVLDCPSTQRTHCAPQTCCGNQRNEALQVAVDGDISNVTDQSVASLRRVNLRSSQPLSSGDTGGDNQKLTDSVNTPV